MSYIESPDVGKPFREEYLGGVKNLLASRRAACRAERLKFATPEKFAANRESFRREYLATLGWPLCDPRPELPPDWWQERVDVSAAGSGAECDYYGNPADIADISRIKVKVFDEYWLYGVLFVPKHIPAGERRPVVISQHGGLGTPELVSGMTGSSANYNGMTMRVLERGAVVFAPQLLIWSTTADGNPVFDRQKLDSSLKQCGSSIAALEIYALTRAIDWLVTLPEVDPDRIGMIGLSYGSFYTLYTAAADTRIRSAVASCSFNDRDTYDWPDFTWPGASGKFYDAEVAGLVAPRALVLEAGDNDYCFAPDGALSELPRAKEFYRASGAEDKLLFNLFEGTHELYKGAEDIDFLFSNL